MEFLKASRLSLFSLAMCVSFASHAQQNNGTDHAKVPLPAREGQRAPQGYARPPFHIHPNTTTSGASLLYPSMVRHAYGFDQINNYGSGQTIAIVDAYDHPRIESDLGVFDQQFGLIPCTSANGCFRKIYASGTQPATDGGWALEIAMDVQWAHAIAPQAKILLVEAKSSSLNDLMAAVDVAVRNGATVVSMSFGGSEFSSETYFDSHFTATGVTFLASSGDSGNGVEYPAASPNVIAVGGTTLNVDAYGNYIGESAWSGGGGGLSAYESEPWGQANWPLPYAGRRGNPDVAYNADPRTGIPVYTSVAYQGYTGWFQMGGTSAGAPQWAGLIAIANSSRALYGKARLSATYNTIYSAAKSAYSIDFNDVTTGSNGTCGFVCMASGGYDYVTGLGSPKASKLVQALVNMP